jgi:hypothetical protein
MAVPAGPQARFRQLRPAERQWPATATLPRHPGQAQRRVPRTGEAKC